MTRTRQVTNRARQVTTSTFSKPLRPCHKLVDRTLYLRLGETKSTAEPPAESANTSDVGLPGRSTSSWSCCLIYWAILLFCLSFFLSQIFTDVT